MSSKKAISMEVKVGIPDGVKASLNGSELTIQGPLGANKRDFRKVPVSLSLSGKEVVVAVDDDRRFNIAVLNTTKSHVRNMIEGVTKGFSYRLKVVYAHFPSSVKVKGSEILIENFYGERSPRIAKIQGSCKVSVEGDDVVVKGASKEDVGQTSANLEKATQVKRRDQRVFLDGIYIYERNVGSG